ncbi:STY4526/YPO1902 family pathogenicity island replication protein [Salinisphaera orenii]|uniref:STY4526/YPO1902 family pathogenicity island replication protein n=1 Tax=Salinisphaera orenii TaxID=856731 RepID=UPI0013A622FF
MSDKDYEIMRAGLHYLMDCVRDRDWKTLHDYGFRDDHIQVLQRITVRDLSFLNQYITPQHLHVQINPEGLVMLVARMQQVRATEDLKHECVRRDAPVDMMSHLFGMNGREYTTLRRTLSRPTNSGRPPQPDTHTLDAIWFAWQKHCGGHNWPATAADWLALADSAEVDLGVVWRFALDMAPSDSAP